MNDEEKKVLELLRMANELMGCILDDKQANIILNLIEKLQKENKEYHRIKKELIRVNKKIYDVDTIDELIKTIDKQQKIIDLMALHIASSAIVDDMVCVYKDCENESCTADMAIQCTKEYFYKKVEKENE